MCPILRDYTSFCIDTRRRIMRTSRGRGKRGILVVPFLFLLSCFILSPCIAQTSDTSPAYVITQVSGPSPSPASDTRQSDPPPLQSLVVEDIEMVLSGVNTLSTSAQQNWAQVTIDFIADQVGDSLSVAQVPYQVSLEMAFTSQRMIENGRLELIFSITLNILSTLQVSQQDAETYVLEAFDSDQEKFDFITLLKDTQEFSFMNAVDVEVTLPSAPPPPTTITVTIPPATKPPTTAPSVAATAPPTLSPTTAPQEDSSTTMEPVPEPTPPPTVAPSLTTSPPGSTSSPTTTALGGSTPSSSSPPTGSTTFDRFQAEGLIMTLGGMEPLNLVDQSIWNQETSAFLEKEILLIHLSSLNGPQVRVVLDVTTQEPPFIPIGKSRHLQAQQQKVMFNAIVSITSSSQEHDVKSYIESSFDSEEKRNDYIDLLKGTGYSAFLPLTFVDVSTSPPPPTTEGGSSTQANNIGATIGIAVAVVVVGAAVIALAVYLLSKRRHYKNSHGGRADSPLSTAVSTHGDQQFNDFADEIEVGSRAEVSTLGDPIPPGMRYGDVLEGGTMFTAATDSLSADYDFTKTYHRSQLSQLESSTVGENDSDAASNVYVNAKDSSSLDEEYLRKNQFSVEAPAGLLGLVIDTSEEGLPTIRAIKETSCLVDEVHVGDILLSVDGEDVTPMMASTVSRLISSKQHNAVRKFVFTRLEGEA